ncbi:hypothetical protein L7F22_009913 [Adiantum nelumboides]|nr:hypothetical protein [Adiantum nelumboides]
MENKWENYPSSDMEAAKLEAYQNLVEITQDLLEKQKPKPKTMPKPEELVVETLKEKTKVVEEPHLETTEPELILPNSKDALNGIPFVEEDWPRHLYKKVREINDGSITLKSAPIEEVWLDHLPIDMDMRIPSLYGDCRSKASGMSKPLTLRTLPSYLGDNLDESIVRKTTKMTDLKEEEAYRIIKERMDLASLDQRISMVNHFTKLLFPKENEGSSKEWGNNQVSQPELISTEDSDDASLHNEVQEYVTHCSKCQVNKAERLKAGGLLHPLEIPQGKWESISMDFIVGLPTTARGHDSVWVVIDRLTKMCRFIPTKTTIKTPKLARLFVEQLYRLYGLPSNIVSDRDRKFNSHFWRAVFKRLGTQLGSLQDQMDMLKLARQNVCQAQDRYNKYTDEMRRQVVFKEGDYVFLRVPEHSESLKTGPTPQLSPRFCGPFKILRQVGSMAYKLELSANSRVHPVFHVSRLRQRLLREDNIIDQEVLVDFIEPPNLSHEPEQILDSHDLHTHHHVRHQVLVKWKDRPEEGATWENVSTLKKRFPSFVFKDENTSPRGGVMLGQGPSIAGIPGGQGLGQGPD